MADIAFITKPDALTMSSREIADLTGKRHDNVVRDIEKMLNDVKTDRLKFEGVYLDAKGEKRKCYNLPQDLTYTLVAGYRPDLRLKIVRRWMELEATPKVAAPALPKTYSEALLEAGRLAQKLEVAEEQAKLQAAMLEVAQPKADALDRISIASGEYGLTETAKIIQIKPGKFFDWLDANRCRYTRGKVKLAYQDKIDAGYFRNRATFHTDANGERQAGNTIRVTPKGLTWLARVVPGAKLDPAFKDIAEATPVPFTQAPA